jgi:hypothetical protein
MDSKKQSKGPMQSLLNGSASATTGSDESVSCRRPRTRQTGGKAQPIVQPGHARGVTRHTANNVYDLLTEWKDHETALTMVLK